MRNLKTTAFIVAAMLALSSFTAQPAFAEDDVAVEEEVQVNRDIEAATSYELTLQVSCSGINQANSYCEVYPEASNENGSLEGSIEVALCIFLNSDAEDKACHGLKAISTGGKGPSAKDAPESVLYYNLPLDKWSTIKVKNYTYGKNLAQEIVLEDAKALANVFDFWIGSGKKFLSLKLTTANMVLLGETKTYKITSSPKVTGKCTLYRSQFGNSYKVGSATLKNGVASGKLRWLWTTAGQTVPMTLKAYCENSKYEGEKIILVNGIRK